MCTLSQTWGLSSLSRFWGKGLGPWQPPVNWPPAHQKTSPTRQPPETTQTDKTVRHYCLVCHLLLPSPPGRVRLDLAVSDGAKPPGQTMRDLGTGQLGRLSEEGVLWAVSRNGEDL